MRIYMGIDNGLDGRLCVLQDGGHHRLFKTPISGRELLKKFRDKSNTSSRSEYDVVTMCRLVQSIRSRLPDGAEIHAGIEATIQRNSHSGAMTSFKTRESLSRGLTCWSVAMRFSDIPLVSVAPNTWQSHFKLQKKSKDEHAELAVSLGGNIPLIKRPRAADLLDHDSADAFLIATWVREHWDELGSK